MIYCVLESPDRAQNFHCLGNYITHHESFLFEHVSHDASLPVHDTRVSLRRFRDRVSNLSFQAVSRDEIVGL